MRAASPFALLHKSGTVTPPNWGQPFQDAGQAIRGAGGRFGSDMASQLQRGKQQAGVNYRQATDAASDAGARQARGGFKQALGGGLKTLWNVSASPLHTVGSGLVGGIKGAINGPGFLQGATQGANSAFQADANDINTGIVNQIGGVGNMAAGVGKMVAAPVYGAASAAQGFVGHPYQMKSAFAMLSGDLPVTARQPAPYKSLSAPPTTSMSEVNKWIASAAPTGGPNLPDRPGARRALSPAPAPKPIGADLKTLGMDTPAGKGMQMTGPGSGFAAGVPVVDKPSLAPLPTPAASEVPDLRKFFRKYHGTSYNPNSTMDQGKLKQMEEVYREHGKLSPALVYSRQYGPNWSKSASAFAELEKSASVAKGLSWILNRGGQALRRSGGKARSVADSTGGAPSSAPIAMGKPTPAPGPASSGTSIVPHATANLDAPAARYAGERRMAAGKTLKNWSKSLADPSLGKKVDLAAYGLGGGGLLFGANRLGHSSGRRSGVDEGFHAGSEAALAAMPEQRGYLGNLWSAIVGQQPTDAAAIRNMLEQNKSDILQTILSGRA